MLRVRCFAIKNTAEDRYRVNQRELPPNLVYIHTMSSRKKPSKESQAVGFVLGRERFAKISAVEGLELTEAMRERSAEFDRRGLSSAERRREILKVYRKKKG